MNTKKEIFFEYLDERKNTVTAEVTKLAGEDRKDESNMLRAKANIYDIFKAIWGACEKMSEGDSTFISTFNGKVEAITLPWGKSLEAAKAHNDVHKVMIEEAKLSAVNEVKEKIASLFN